MNFFEHQRQAKKKTKVLVLYFVLSVISLIFITNLVIVFAMKYQSSSIYGIESFWSTFFRPKILLISSLGTSLVIFLGSLFKILTLSGNGAKVCRSVGAREINSHTKNLHERIFINIVEEISIASGVPIPRTFILDDSSINAFAAGTTIKNAAICVTTGSIKSLSRDELQAVIAHEYGHIFNGDMKLNVRLIGIVFGIVCISKIGEILIRSNRRSRSRKNGGQAALIGLGFLIAGSIGVFFASLIKSAISREREYLADASAVQYTRNPIAMINVFKKIYCLQDTQIMDDSIAKEVNHMFFTKGFDSVFATHPPVDQRIIRIDKKFNFEKFKNSSEIKELKLEIEEISSLNSAPEGVSQFNQNSSVRNIAPEIIESSYLPQSELEDHKPIKKQIDYISKLISEIPAELQIQTRTPFGAKSVLCCFALDDNLEIQSKQFETLREDAELSDIVRKNYQVIKGLDKKYRLPLIELSLRSIKSLNQKELDVFKALFLELAIADNKIELHEALISSLLDSFNLKSKILKENVKLRKLRIPAQSVLSALIYISCKNDIETAQKIFTDSCQQLGIYTTKLFQNKNQLFKDLSSNLKTLANLKLEDKEKYLKVLNEIVIHDQKVTFKEQEVMRFIAQALNVPAPLIHI